ESILVKLPLVFWNAARIHIGTDGKYMAPTGDPNPLRYRGGNLSQRSITNAEKSDDTIRNGVVMWYRADRRPEGPSDDAEDSLAEWTVRDHDYLTNPDITQRTSGKIPDSECVTLINYDVSNVDTLYVPLAMAANNAWVLPPKGNRNGWADGGHPLALGWTG